MFGEPGLAYVYFVYGMHHMFNVVTEPEGQPGAVLVRALEPLQGVEMMSDRRATDDPRGLCSGPGKLCSALDITLDMNGVDLVQGPLGIVGGEFLEERRIVATPRIGVVGSRGEPYRFMVDSNPYVSRK